MYITFYLILSLFNCWRFCIQGIFVTRRIRTQYTNSLVNSNPGYKLSREFAPNYNFYFNKLHTTCQLYHKYANMNVSLFRVSANQISVFFSYSFPSVRKTLWNFIGHLVLLGESFHRTELISVWLWVYIVYTVLEATSDISVLLEMRQIESITYLSCQPKNLANTAFQQLVFSLVRLLTTVTSNLFRDFAFHFIFRTHPLPSPPQF